MSKAHALPAGIVMCTAIVDELGEQPGAEASVGQAQFIFRVESSGSAAGQE